MHLGIIPCCLAIPPMYGQRRSRISGFRTRTRSFVLKNAMNVQARESVCYGKNCIVGQKAYNINVFSFSVQNSVTPIIESVRTPARITPYPTGRLFGVAIGVGTKVGFAPPSEPDCQIS